MHTRVDPFEKLHPSEKKTGIHVIPFVKLIDYMYMEVSKSILHYLLKRGRVIMLLG